MRRLITAQLVSAILSHPQTPALVGQAAREAVAEVAERLERHAARSVVQATIEREESDR
jgi:hypothetical protein